MAYNFDTFGYIELINALVALIIIFILWPLRDYKGVKFLIILQICVFIWALTYALEFGSTELDIKRFWSQLSYFGIAFTPLNYFLFASAFSDRKIFINKRNIVLLSILPLITIFLVLTNNQHHLIWTNVFLDDQINIAHYEHGFMFWVFLVYTEILLFSGIYFLIKSIHENSNYHKSQVYLLLIGSILPILGNLIYIININPVTGFDWTPISFVLTGFFIALGILRFKMFDIIPIARSRLLDIMNDGIIVIDTKGIIEDYNPAIKKILNHKKNSLLGKPINSIIPEFDDFNNIIKSQKEKRLELSLNQNNSTKHFEVIITPLFNKNNIFSGHIILFHDITHIKKTEFELKSSNNQLLHQVEEREKLISDLDAFAHSVAHGLKNPLGAIVSTTELIDHFIEEKDIDSLTELNELIKSASNKTLHITNELLTLASVRKQEIKTEKIDMLLLINEAIRGLQNLIDETKATIKISKKIPTSLGYSPWLEEVWVNFISNAIKYGGPDPVIKIGATVLQDGSVKYWIKDSGDGIPTDKQNLLFHQFSRLNPKIAEGHGLGLSIVRRIIEKLNGGIGVESSGKKGEGALFYFTLPVK